MKTSNKLHCYGYMGERCSPPHCVEGFKAVGVMYTCKLFFVARVIQMICERSIFAC